MNKVEVLDMCAYVEVSTYRNRVMSSLYGDEVYKTPIQIAKESNIRPNHISKVLHELKKCSLVQCINEERRKGRLYCLTEKGKQICDHMVLQNGVVYKGVLDE